MKPGNIKFSSDRELSLSKHLFPPPPPKTRASDNSLYSYDKKLISLKVEIAKIEATILDHKNDRQEAID